MMSTAETLKKLGISERDFLELLVMKNNPYSWTGSSVVFDHEVSFRRPPLVPAGPLSITLGGAGWVLGNGTLFSVYAAVGRWILGDIGFFFGSTSTAGAGALYFAIGGGIRVPLTNFTVPTRFFDVSAPAEYGGVGVVANTGGVPSVYPKVNVLSGVIAGSPVTTNYIAAGTPFVWAAGDTIETSFAFAQA